MKLTLKSKTPFIVTAAILLFGVIGLFSCEDDAIVTPTKDDTDDCTGSYCELDMNKSTKDIVLVQNNNPQTF